MTTQSNQVAESHEYDWDLHETLMADLPVLERVEREVRNDRIHPDSHPRFLLRGPYGDNPQVQGTMQADFDVLREYSDNVRNERISTLVGQHLDLCRGRGELAAKHLEATIFLFPEGKFRPGLYRMAGSVLNHAADMKERTVCFRPIMSKKSEHLVAETPFDVVKEYILSLRQAFNDTAACDDPAPVQERLAAYERSCDILSKVVLFHARLQRDLAEECLAALTTALVFRDVYKVETHMNFAAYKKISIDMMAGSSIDLDFANNIRRTIYTMGERGAPAFLLEPYTPD